MTHGWKTPANARDYLSEQQRKLNIADRRGANRRAEDLVGPGFSPGTRRLDNFNDPVLTMTGFYSVGVNPENGPLPRTGYWGLLDSYDGYVVSDSAAGGEQVFSGTVSGAEYRRRFRRAPGDRDSVVWEPWRTKSPYPLGASYVDGTDSADLPANTIGRVLTPPPTVVTPAHVDVLSTGGPSAANYRFAPPSFVTRSSTSLIVSRPGTYTVRGEFFASSGASISLSVPDDFAESSTARRTVLGVASGLDVQVSATFVVGSMTRPGSREWPPLEIRALASNTSSSNPASCVWGNAQITFDEAI